MTDRQNRPIPDSYWLHPGRLLAGEYPRHRDDAAARAKLRRLLEAGVTFFLDLTEPGEHGLKPYASLLRQEATALGRSIVHQRMPVPDGETPTPAGMTRILNAMDTALAEGHVVYVHCFGGIGRTGTVAGCYLVRHGMGGAEALAEIARLRQGTPDGDRPSPETSAQASLVLRWPVGG